MGFNIQASARSHFPVFKSNGINPLTDMEMFFIFKSALPYSSRNGFKTASNPDGGVLETY